MKIGKINAAKRFTAVLLSVLMLVSVAVLPANAETINNETSSTTNEVKFKEVSIGGSCCAALAEDGSLYTWGENWSGQLGDGLSGGTAHIRYSPTKIMDNVKSISRIGGRSYAITDDNTLYAWGTNRIDSYYYSPGLLGDGTTTNKFTPTKILENVKSISLEENKVAAITTDGSLYTWGYNVGNGTGNSYSTPIKILDNVKSVCLGGSHSAAITENGTLYTWGNNSSGQLGDGTTTSRHSPTKVLYNVKSVSLGDSHSAAITEDGSLYTWGYNGYGQLGDGTTAGCYLPTKVMDNVKYVRLTQDNSYAITEDNTLYAWGNNSDGQLGDGTEISKSTPVEIFKNVKSIDLSLDYESSSWLNEYAIITLDDTLYTWGYNGFGQLGDGTTTYRSSPTKILNNVKAVSVYGSLAAITKDGSLYTWGSNRYGGLGDGTCNNDYNIRYYPAKITVEPTITPNSLVITKGPIDLEVGKSYIIDVKYYDENCKIAEIEDGLFWTHGSEVNVEVLNNDSGYYNVKVTGKKEGTCDVTALATEGRSISTTFNVSYPEANVQYEFTFPDETGTLAQRGEKTIKWENGAYSQTDITAELTIFNNKNLDGTGGNLTLNKVDFSLINLDMFKIDTIEGNLKDGESITLAPGEKKTFTVKLKKKGITWKKPSNFEEYHGSIKVKINGSKKSGESGNFTDERIVTINYWNQDLKNEQDLISQEKQQNIEKSKLDETNVNKAKSALDKCTFGINTNTLVDAGYTAEEISQITTTMKVWVASIMATYSLSQENMAKSEWSKILEGSGVTSSKMQDILTKATTKAFKELGVDISMFTQLSLDVAFDNFDAETTIKMMDSSGKKVDSEIKVMVHFGSLSLKDANNVASLGTIKYTVNKNKQSYNFGGNGSLFTYAEMKEFAAAIQSIGESAIKGVYDETIGGKLTGIKNFIRKSTGDYTSSAIIRALTSDTADKLLEKKFGKFSDNCYKLYTNSLTWSSSGSVHCPVDVYIYDGLNNLVGYVIDNEVVVNDDSITLYCVGDEKYFTLSDDDYSIKLVGNDTGTMKYEIKEYLNGELERELVYDDIPLKENKIYVGIIPEYNGGINNTYDLITPDQEEPISLTSETKYEPDYLDTDFDTDTDSDIKKDSDSDTDSDIKIDSDTDTDSDIKIDSDTDTDSDIKTDSDSDTDSDIKIDSDTDTDSDIKKDSDTDTDSDTDSDTKKPTTPDKPKAPTPLGTVGDLDGDGNITSADALLILRASVKLENFTDIQNKLADADNDGNISSSDALLVLRHSVGLKDTDTIGKVLTQ